MLRPLVLLLFILAIAGFAEAQTVDSSRQKIDSVRGEVQGKADQQTKKVTSKLDSLQSLASVSRYTDSLKIDAWSDSMRHKINSKFSDKFISHKMDSLGSLNSPDERFTQVSDSIRRKKENLLREVTNKQQALQERVSHRYNGWEKGLKEKFNLDSSGIKLPAYESSAKDLREKLNLDSAGVKLPTFDPAISDPLQRLNLPSSTVQTDANLPRTDMPAATVPGIPEIPALNTGDFSSLDLSKDLTNVGGSIAIPSTDQLSKWNKNLPGLPDPMKEITDKVGAVKALTTDPGKAAEQAVGQISEVSDATKALKEAEALKQQNEALKIAEQAKDPEALKEMAKQEAINHFQGQEAALQGAMSQMAKYKKKYASLGSLSEIKKNDWLPRNGLKGKPFRERFRIGLHTGFKSQGDTLLLDFYPNASYRITGRIEAGMGAIYRVRVTTKEFGFDQRDPVWGMAMFTVIKAFKSVHLRVELDGNSFPKPGSIDQPTHRDWRWSFHSGIQTNFKLGKQWTSNIQMLYNFDSNLKDGFPEKLTLRFGVQYKLRAKRTSSN